MLFAIAFKQKGFKVKYDDPPWKDWILLIFYVFMSLLVVSPIVASQEAVIIELGVFVA